MTTNTATSKYIGDGVYATFNGYDIILTTGSHLIEEATSAIVLEPDAADELIKFIELVGAS